MMEPDLMPLAQEQCPDCGHRGVFLRGPAGGASVNIECAPCGSRFNIATHEGELIMAHRIRYNGIWPDRGWWSLQLLPSAEPILRQIRSPARRYGRTGRREE